MTVQAAFVIDEEFEAKLPLGSHSEDLLLESSIVDSGGPLEPLVVWEGPNILIDGHRRRAICMKHGLPYSVRYLRFDSREDALNWVLTNQLARRNLTDHDRSVMLSALYESLKESVAGGVLADTVAEHAGCSRRTVFRANAYTRALRSLHPAWQTQIRRGNLGKEHVCAIAGLLHEDQVKLFNEIESESHVTNINDFRDSIRRLIGKYSNFKFTEKEEMVRGYVPTGAKIDTVINGFEPEATAIVEALPRERIDRGFAAIRDKAREVSVLHYQLSQELEQLLGDQYANSPVLKATCVLAMKKVSSAIKFVYDTHARVKQPLAKEKGEKRDE